MSLDRAEEQGGPGILEQKAGRAVLLALAGLVITVAGALGPAGWAAGTRTAFALRAE